MFLFEDDPRWDHSMWGVRSPRASTSSDLHYVDLLWMFVEGDVSSAAGQRWAAREGGVGELTECVRLETCFFLDVRRDIGGCSKLQTAAAQARQAEIPGYGSVQR